MSKQPVAYKYATGEDLKVTIPIEISFPQVREYPGLDKKLHKPHLSEETLLPNGNVRVKMHLSGCDVPIVPGKTYVFTMQVTGSELPRIIKANEVTDV